MVVISLGGVESALAKKSSKNELMRELGSLNKTRQKARKPAALDDIELDDEASTPASPAPAQPIAVTEKIPDQIRLLLAAAEVHEKDGNSASVISTLKGKVDQLPRSGLLMLARAYEKTKNYPSQIRALELVIAKNPKDYVAITELGEGYLNAKRIEDAANAFGRSREINPKYRPAYEGALALLETTQETYEARTLVLDIIKKFGADAKSTATLCRLYSGEGFVPERSEEACRRAISADPKNPENYVYLTYALRDTEQKEQAFKTISGAASRFPASEDVQSLAGELKATDKSFAESYRFYTQAVKANEKSARAQVGFAKSAFELQKHAEAIEAFVKACKLDRKTTLDFRQAATTLKRNKDAKWMTYQDAIDDRCD
jgi:tetratricopeptide (TPR) repeat protein